MSTVKLVWDVIERMREDNSLPWEVRSRLEEIQWYEDYADGRDAPNGIVAANWNDIGEWKEGTRKLLPHGNIMSRLEKLFDHYGVKIEWSDQGTCCDQCYKFIQTEPDSYSWQPEFIVRDGYITCASCIAEDPEPFLQEKENDPSSCWPLDNIDPSDYGYVKLNHTLDGPADSDGDRSYETGWHRGQDDNPKTIAKNLRDKGCSRFIFVLDENSQFYSRWSAYLHEEEMDLVRKVKSKATDAKYSNQCTEVSYDEYVDAREGYTGWCVECKEFTRDCTEPDAIDLPCEVCNNDSVLGAETALIMGIIEVDEK